MEGVRESSDETLGVAIIVISVLLGVKSVKVAERPCRCVRREAYGSAFRARAAHRSRPAAL